MDPVYPMTSGQATAIIWAIVILTIVVIAMFLFMIFFVVVPMSRIETTVNKTSTEISSSLAQFRVTSDQVKAAIPTFYQAAQNIDNIYATATTLEQRVEAAIAEAKAAACHLFPTLPFCG